MKTPRSVATSPKTIAIDARIIATGTGRYVERLIYYLEQIDKINHYLILVRAKDLNYYKPTNPNFDIVEAEFADYSFGEQIGFARLLYSLKADLVHFCMPQQPLLYLRPSITTVHDLNLLRINTNDNMGRLELIIKKMIFGGLLTIVAHRTKHVLATSNYTKQDLIKFSHIPDRKVTVTYEATDVNISQPEPVESLVDKDFILYVGRAEAYKNNRGLIKAHHQLLKRFPNLRLVIASKIDDLRMHDMIWVDQQGYKQVDFLGVISNEELAWLYRNCRAYVIASFMEGFGLPALEAMSSGAPVVSSNTTCMPEVLQDGAHYFDPHSTDEIVRAISEVLSDDGLRKKLIINGQNVCAKYSWRRMAEQTLEVYNHELIASSRGA
ncbi:MAG TPA: glycosyltransferase family 1 protein [Patescibacteria group bacterium]|jgi:glycosyltransferase involved in cell wall biosynthesis|nr:glycosyltransferase family 1 protein [Patescibacteria group bacterium]